MTLNKDKIKVKNVTIVGEFYLLASDVAKIVRKLGDKELAKQIKEEIKKHKSKVRGV